MRNHPSGHRLGLGILAAMLLLPPSTAVGEQDSASPIGQEDPAGSVGDRASHPPTTTVPPRLIEFVEAKYPEEALAAGLEGRVLLRLEIDAAGRVIDVTVLDPAGHGFEAAASDAARAFRFSPARAGDTPVSATLEYLYSFTLTRSADSTEVGEERRQAPSEAPSEAPPEGQAKESPDVQPSPTGSSPGSVIEVTDSIGAAPSVTRSVSMEEVRMVPGTFGDAVRVVQNLPGTARTPFGLGVILVRGTGPNDSGTYLNGMEVPILFHFGGLISVFNSSVLERVDYLPGGYSARLGRHLGGAIELATRTTLPEALTSYADVNLMDSSAYLEGLAAETLGYSIALRRSYLDVVAAPFLSNMSGIQFQLPRYWDGQIKLDYHPTSGDRLQLMLFASDDRFAVLGETSEGESGEEAQEAALSTTTTALKLHAQWLHTEGSTFSHRLTFQLGPDYQETILPFASIQSSPVYAALRSDISWKPAEALLLYAGLDLQVTRFNVDLEFEFPDESGEATVETISLNDWGIAPAIYAEIDYTWRDRFTVVPGLRLEPLVIPGQYSKSRADPRLSARLRLGESTWMKAAIGRYTQFPEPYQMLDGIGNPALDPSYSIQTSIGLNYAFKPELKLELVGYYNDLRDLVVNSSNEPIMSESDGGDSSLNLPFTNDEMGRSYGMEFLLRRASRDGLFGWISYTLSRSERLNSNTEAWDLYTLDQTHNLTLVAGVRLSDRWALSSRFRYVTGAPYTPVEGASQDLDDNTWVPIDGEANSARNDSFHALDLRVERTWIQKHWKLDLYLDVQNVYNRQNPEFTYYSFDYRETQVISGLPFLPVLGLKGTF